MFLRLVLRIQAGLNIEKIENIKKLSIENIENIKTSMEMHISYCSSKSACIGIGKSFFFAVS